MSVSYTHLTSEYLREAFTAHNLKLLPEVELNSNDLLLDLARIGLGIACVPDYMLKENDQLTPLMLKEPLPGRQLVLAQHDSLTVSQTALRTTSIAGMPPEACNIPLTETILSASTVRIALPVPYTAATQHSGLSLIHILELKNVWGSAEKSNLF